jgi:hypothetical protein
MTADDNLAEVVFPIGIIIFGEVIKIGDGVRYVVDGENT